MRKIKGHYIEMAISKKYSNQEAHKVEKAMIIYIFFLHLLPIISLIGARHLIKIKFFLLIKFK